MSDKILVYDGDCPMCGWISRRFVELGWVEDENRRSFQSFHGEVARTIEEAGIRNEMIVLDEASGELRSGVSGFSWLLEGTRLRVLVAILALPPVATMLELAYRTIAYNRRVLAPPARGTVCDCDPDPHRGFRALFLIVLGIFALGGGAACGAALRQAMGIGGPAVGAVAALSLALALALLGRLAAPFESHHLVGHGLMIVVVGLLAALPAVLPSLLVERSAAWMLLTIGAMFGSAFALRSLARRFVYLQSQSRTAGSSS